MEKILIFLFLSIPVLILSRRSLFKIKSHGIYRFFGWECIIWLLVSNYKFWFVEPFSIHQIISWLLLVFSVYLIMSGLVELKKFGKQSKSRKDDTLYKFEQTTELIESGIFKYIRHPMYSSLFFLAWGIFFKQITFELFFVTFLASVFLFLTAIADEKECLINFGEKYGQYMKRTKRFLPFIF